jgi:hypothetical protein
MSRGKEVASMWCSSFTYCTEAPSWIESNQPNTAEESMGDHFLRDMAWYFSRSIPEGIPRSELWPRCFRLNPCSERIMVCSLSSGPPKSTVSVSADDSIHRNGNDLFRDRLQFSIRTPSTSFFFSAFQVTLEP